MGNIGNIIIGFLKINGISIFMLILVLNIISYNIKDLIKDIKNPKAGVADLVLKPIVGLIFIYLVIPRKVFFINIYNLFRDILNSSGIVLNIGTSYLIIVLITVVIILIIILLILVYIKISNRKLNN